MYAIAPTRQGAIRAALVRAAVLAPDGVKASARLRHAYIGTCFRLSTSAHSPVGQGASSPALPHLPSHPATYERHGVSRWGRRLQCLHMQLSVYFDVQARSVVERKSPMPVAEREQ